MIDPALHGAITVILLMTGLQALIGCVAYPGYVRALGLRLLGAVGCLAVGVWYLATWP